MLQKLDSSLVNYRAHEMDIRGIDVAPMEQHRFPWAQTFEIFFVSWNEYESSNPFQDVFRDDY